MWYAMLAAIFVFLLLSFCSFLPFCFLRVSPPRPGAKRGSSLAMSLGNCFACGVFISTCFLGLIPHIRMHENRIRAMLSEPNQSAGYSQAISPVYSTLLNSELIVLVGFLMILIFEQSVYLCSSTADSAVSRDHHDMHDLAAEEPLVNAACLTDETEDLHFRTHSHAAHGESGHSHHHGLPLGSSLSLRSFLLLFGLSIHSIFEGVAIGVQSDAGDFTRLMIAVLLHEVLCSFAFGVSLCQQRARPLVALASVLFLSACIPVGMSSAFLVSEKGNWVQGLQMSMVDPLTAVVLRFVLEGLAAGTFVYVACVEMLSAELNRGGQHGSRDGFLQATMVTLGVVAFFLLSLISSRGEHDEHAH